MKNHLNLFRITVLGLVFLFLTGCSSDEGTIATPPSATIIGIATTNQPNLTTLATALNRFPDLVTTLNSTGNFTVFAPTNAAFTKFLASTTFATVNDVPLPILREIVLNHVLNGNYTTIATAGATTFSSGYLKTLAKGSASSTNTLSMYVNASAGSVLLNGISFITTANIFGTNGVVHIVDDVISLPSIATHAVANPSFSTLAAVVSSTGGVFGDQSAVASVFASYTAPLTVFAPTNDAFAAAVATGAWANNITPAQITKVLQYHVTGAGNILATSLTQGRVLSMITSPVLTTTIDLVGGAKIKDTQNIAANISITDVQCTNGVLHAVDKVLRPF